MAAGRRYTRAVTAAKLVLPLLAAGLLSLLVVLARSTPEGEPLRFVDGALERLAQSQRVGSPRHASVTEDGGELTITAEVLTPDPDRPRVSRGTNLAATLRMPDGTVYDATGAQGVLDEPAMHSTLRGDVVVVSSRGAVLRTQALRMRNDQSYMETLAPVRIDQARGWLQADRMEIFADPDDDLRTRMVFTGDVHLLYTP